MLRMTDLDLAGKRVLIREDLNVPVKDGVVTSDARIRAAVPTLRAALDAGAAVIAMSHLGRPRQGEYDEQFSMQPVADRLGELLGAKVRVIRDYPGSPSADRDLAVEPGQIVLLENVRFNVGEKADDERLAKKMAALADVFVMDAFGTAHRAQASTHGVAKFAPVACAGPLLVRELDMLHRALDEPARPVVAIVGGSKVSTKLGVLEALADKVDQLIVGGGIANTFIAAAGQNVGKSLYEADLVDQAKELIARAKEKGTDIPIPVDVVVATEFAESAEATVRAVGEVGDDEMILDVGPQTSDVYAGLLMGAGTVIWNGPVGVFEFDQFGGGTRALAEAIAASEAFSVVGGGDSLAALDKYGLGDKMSYLSTGGGAFLEFVEGKTLPAVAMLAERAARAK